MVEPSLLTEIRRQRHEVDRRIVELAHSGRGSDALDLLHAEGRLAIADTIDEARRAVVLDWYGDYSSGSDAVMIARRNRDVTELNADARALLIADGRVGGEVIRIAEGDFAVGDRVLTRVNSSEVSNRERWLVTALDAEGQTIELRRLGGDARVVTLGPDYLARYTDSGEPALQNAYALTVYGTQSKTFERTYALLDAGANSEEFVVAVSRARDKTRAYGVASLELTDPELGPGRRAIEDDFHDLRRAIEAGGSDYPALEVSARRRIEALSEPELAARRRELKEIEQDYERTEPGQERREILDRQIKRAQETLQMLSDEREAIGALRKPDPGQLAQLKSREASAAQALERLQADRAEVGEQQTRPAALSSEQRLNLCLIEERMSDLCRRQIAAERLKPSLFVREALGERPTEARKLEAWNEGAEAIHSYRQRHGVRDPRRALGGEPKGPSARVDHARAQQAIRQAQRRLELGRPLGMERSIGIERGISIGR